MTIQELIEQHKEKYCSRCYNEKSCKIKVNNYHTINESFRIQNLSKKCI